MPNLSRDAVPNFPDDVELVLCLRYMALCVPKSHLLPSLEPALPTFSISPFFSEEIDVDCVYIEHLQFI